VLTPQFILPPATALIRANWFALDAGRAAA
jgi:hypothetical protein